MASLLTHTELVMFELRVSPGSPLKQEVHGHSHCGLQLGEERSGPLHTAQSPLVLSEGRVPIHKGDGTSWDVSGGGGPMGNGPGPFVWLTWRRAASGVPGTSL